MVENVEEQMELDFEYVDKNGNLVDKYQQEKQDDLFYRDLHGKLFQVPFSKNIVSRDVKVNVLYRNDLTGRMQAVETSFDTYQEAGHYIASLNEFKNRIIKLTLDTHGWSVV